MKVLIVGAGVSGLILAQILRKAGIDCEVFERDDGTRTQGWSIGLDKCLPYLQDLLPDDLEPLESASANYGRERDNGLAVLDATSHELLGVIPLSSKAGPNHGMYVSRNKLRSILSEHLEIQHGKRFLEYEEGADGVLVRFGDGSESKGTILVGADGANSVVRSRLLSGFTAAESQYTMIIGDTVLPKEVYDPVLKNSGCGIIAATSNMKSYLVLEAHLGSDARFSWACAWRDADFEANHVWSRGASQKDLLQRALSKLQCLPEYILRGIKMTEPSGVQKPPIRLLETVLPPDGIPKGRVTLVGDSAHSMLPFRGMGANLAIIDACELGKSIMEAVEAEIDMAEMLQKYNEVMVPRGRTAVLESRATGESEDAREIAGGRI